MQLLPISNLYLLNQMALLKANQQASAQTQRVNTRLQPQQTQHNLTCLKKKTVLPLTNTLTIPTSQPPNIHHRPTIILATLLKASQCTPINKTIITIVATSTTAHHLQQFHLVKSLQEF